MGLMAATAQGMRLGMLCGKERQGLGEEMAGRREDSIMTGEG